MNPTLADFQHGRGGLPRNGNSGPSVLQLEKAAIEKAVQDACCEFNIEPDWTKNMYIWDKLNKATYLCPVAITEIRKQLKTKNPDIEMLALQLTESIIKNCPS